NDGTAKLIDLGFAHRPGENAAFMRDGYLLGTVNYMAPELCANAPQADQRADLFSFGVTLFEMLTGQLPYSKGDARQTLKRHRCDPPADIRQFAGGLPSRLIILVERLLAHKQEERPRARAIVQQLIALEIGALGHRRAA